MLRVNTVSMSGKQKKSCWLPISALTKDHSDNWAVYAVETQDDDREKVVRHQVVLKRVEQNQALIIPPAGNDSQKIMADGLHLVVPGQIVNSATETE